MNKRPSEESRSTSRLLKCTLEVEAARAYWTHWRPDVHTTAQCAFDEYWFGARSLNRVSELLANLRARFDAFPSALPVLNAWSHMDPDTRRNVCHWHLQLAEPLFRSFTGEYLVDRRAGARPEITHDLAVRWVVEQCSGRWTMSTCIQFASKLLTSAHAAGLLARKIDPRPLTLPRVTDEALTYLMYLLRETEFDGTLLANPYLASVGLDGSVGEDRLRRLPALGFRRQAGTVDFGWKFPDLQSWAGASVCRPSTALEAAA